MIPLCMYWLFSFYCRDSQNNPLAGTKAIAGAVETVHIDLAFDNIGEDPALGSEIVFTLPRRFRFIQTIVPAGSPSVSACTDL